MRRGAAIVRAEPGVTLTELVITLGLFSMVMLAVVGVWGKSQEAYFVGSETAEVQQNVRAAIDFMVREIRAAGRDVTVCAFDYGVAAAGDPGDCSDAKRDACRCRLNSTCADATPYSSCANVFAIPEARPNFFRIRADRNDDGLIDSSGDEDVKYELTVGSPCTTSQCITRRVGSTTTAIVAVDIQGFTVTYFPVPGYGPCAPDGSGNIPDPCPAFTDADLDGTGATDQVNRDRIGRIRIVVNAVQPLGGDPNAVSRTLTTDVVLRNRS
jgi:Tfp pilus assembly protein PilW